MEQEQTKEIMINKLKLQKLDRNAIDALRKLLGGASSQPLLVGALRESTHEEIVAYFANTLSKEPETKCWAVWYQAPDKDNPEKEGSYIVAITGNGPTSHGNAKFLSIAPRAVFDLINDRAAMCGSLKAIREALSIEGENGLEPRDLTCIQMDVVVRRLTECIDALDI